MIKLTEEQEEHMARLDKLSPKQIERLDLIEELTAAFVSAILGKNCRYIQDHMGDIVHEILAKVTKWGVEHKGVNEMKIYPHADG